MVLPRRHAGLALRSTPRCRVGLLCPVGVLCAAGLLCTLGLTACTSSSATRPTTSSSSTPVSTAAATRGRVEAPATLATTLQKGLASATSAHLVVSTKLSGQTLHGEGDVALQQGAITRARLQQDLPSGLGSISVVVTGAKTYAKLPSALRTDASRPWVLLTPDSRSIVVSQLASSVQPILTVASPASLIAFTRSASSVTDLGPQSSSGVTTTHYRVIVDADKLPPSVPSSITAGGKSDIPLDIYLDPTGRPRQVIGTFSISGQTVTPTIMLSAYNAAVSVAAPPPEQVSTK